MPRDQDIDTLAADILNLLGDHLEEGPYSGIGFSCIPQLAPTAGPALKGLLREKLAESRQKTAPVRGGGALFG